QSAQHQPNWSRDWYRILLHESGQTHLAVAAQREGHGLAHEVIERIACQSTAGRVDGGILSHWSPKEKERVSDVDPFVQRRNSSHRRIDLLSRHHVGAEQRLYLRSGRRQRSQAIADR